MPSTRCERHSTSSPSPSRSRHRARSSPCCRGSASCARPCRLVVGPHSLTVNAFVIRHPDENADDVHRWLLQHNARHPASPFGVDPLGDVYVVGQLPLTARHRRRGRPAARTRCSTSPTRRSTPCSSSASRTSIRREWEWRVSRGESLANLQAFTHLVDDVGRPRSSPATRSARRTHGRPRTRAARRRFRGHPSSGCRRRASRQPPASVAPARAAPRACEAMQPSHWSLTAIASAISSLVLASRAPVGCRRLLRGELKPS